MGLEVGLKSSPGSRDGRWPDLTIGEVAQRAGVTASTIRYYESIGLLPHPQREHGQRRYDGEVIGRLTGWQPGAG